MNKTFGTAIGAGIVAIAFAPSAHAATVNTTIKTYSVNTTQLNIRTGPSTNYKSVATLPANTLISGISNNGWVKITAGNYAGKYISASYLKTLTGTSNYYMHGSYAQAHYSTLNDCNTARTNNLLNVKNYGGTNITSANCHLISATDNGVQKNGYVYDISYQRVIPIWASDKNYGASAPLLMGAHSYKTTANFSTQSDATVAEANAYKKLSATNGTNVSWRSGVVQNATTKQWTYEIDYNSRMPQYSNDVEISENTGVTTPTQGNYTVPTNTPINNNEDVGVAGIDISSHTTTNDWSGWKNAGIKFIYMKATEGTIYKNPQWANQYTGSYNNGFLRGSYHFANPSLTNSGADQANYFIQNGGNWTNDGHTLPGAVDLEWNPYKSLANGNMCYGLTQTQMTSWINDFVSTYKQKTGINPVIYTANAWWKTCVGSTNYSQNPLWLASYTTTPGTIPTSWSNAGTNQMIWQNAAVDSKGYDTNIFNGTLTQLKQFALTGQRNW